MATEPASRSTPVALFQGYNAVRGQGMNTAVTGQMQVTGGTSFVKCDICYTTSQLSQTLQVEQSLSVSYAPVGTISEKLQFLEKLSASSTTTFIVVFARHTKGKEVVTNVQRDVSVPAPADDKELREFVQLYGDSYLSSRTLGGEYCAVYSYYSDSREQQQELSADITGAGIHAGVSVDASLQVKINNLNSTQRRRISFEHRMSGIANPEFPSSDKITEFALKFPSLELTAPVIIDWTTSGYEQVRGIGSIFNRIARNRELLASPESSKTLSKLKELQESIDAINKVYNLYDRNYKDDTKLSTVEGEVKQDESYVRSMIKDYVDDPLKPLQGPLVLHSLDKGIPSLQYEVQESARISSEDYGPVVFDDVQDPKNFFQQRKRISALQLRSSERLVSCLVVTYSGENMQSQTLNHGTHEHDSGSQLSHILNVLPGRYVEFMSGRIGSLPSMAPRPVITNLAFILDDESSVHGGPYQGQQFGWTKPKSSFLLGFKGCHGWYIENLQIVYASFSPAYWSPN